MEPRFDLLIAAVIAVATSACTPTDPTLFIGNWQYEAGSVARTSCGGQNDDEPLSGTLVITAGTTADLNMDYQFTSTSNCSATFDAGTNNTVNLVTSNCGNAWGIEPSSGTFVISNNNNTLTEHETGTLTIFFVGCTLNVDATLTRI